MSLDINEIIAMTAVLVLGLMFAMTPLLLRHRHERLNRMKVGEIAKHYGFDESDWLVQEVHMLIHQGEEEQSFFKYVLPYLFPVFTVVLLIFMYGYTVLIMEAAEITPKSKSLFVLAENYITPGADNGNKELGLSLTILLGTFLGGFVWSVGFIYRRLASYDLFPLAYFRISMHLITGAFVGIAIRHSMPFEWGGDVGTGGLVALGFYVGYMPSMGLKYILRFAQRRFDTDAGDFSEKGATPNRMPIRYIYGISSYIRTRLEEFEIDDIQNLATENPLVIFARTPFELAEITDWIAQAQFILHISECNARCLREFGIRDIFSLKDQVINNPEFVAQKIKNKKGEAMDVKTLQGLIATIEKDPSFVRLNQLRQRLVLGRAKAVQAGTA